MSDFPDDEPYEDDLEDDDPNAERMNVMELKQRSMEGLVALAESLTVENAAGMRKQDLLFEILKAQTVITSYSIHYTKLYELSR